MPQTIDLPDDLAAALTDEASRIGLSLPEYAVRLLSSARTSLTSVRTVRDLVEFWQAEGLVGSRPDIEDSQAEARSLREQAELVRLHAEKPLPMPGRGRGKLMIVSEDNDHLEGFEDDLT